MFYFFGLAFFCSAELFWGLSTFLGASKVHSFLLSSSIPWSGGARLCWFNCLLMNIWGASPSCLRGFSCGSAGKESACQCRWHRFVPRFGKNSTCHGTTKLVCHIYWACAREPGSHHYWSPCALEPALWSKKNYLKRNRAPTLCNYRKAFAAMKTENNHR